MAVTETSRWWKTLSTGRGTACSTCAKRLPKGTPIIYRPRPKPEVLCTGCVEDAGVHGRESVRYARSRGRPGTRRA
ncbi:MAG TPA: hypothetical protein VIL49_18195 [Capillimicrobium sp.]